MTVTVNRIVGIRDLELAVHVGPADGVDAERRAAAPLSWVYSSNLEDPTPFLPPGQLLLTDGSQFRRRTSTGVKLPQRFDAYVERLCDAGLLGLGLGTGLGWEHVPQALIDACRSHGLPLVEIPYAIPFLAVIRAAADLLDKEHEQHIQWGLDAQRAISRVAMKSEHLDALLNELARQLRCGVSVYAANGQLIGSAHKRPWTDRQRDVLHTAMDRLARHATRSAARMSIDGEEFILQSIGSPTRQSGYLILTGLSTLDGVQRTVVEGVLALTAVTLEYQRASAHQNRVLRGALLRLSADGHAHLAGDVSRQITDERFPRGRGAVIAVAPVSDLLATQLDALAASSGCFWGLVDDVAVIAAPEDAVQAVITACDDVSIRGGVSDPGDLAALGELVTQAQTALDGARPAEIVRFDRLVSSGWPALIHGSLLELSSRKLLDRLDAQSLDEGRTLRDTLRVWLQSNGQWETAAQRLQVHRHTVRNRIHRASELLGLDLDSFDARTHVWLALNSASDGEE